MINSTIVTGIWDLGRGSAKEGWDRKFDHYVSNFKKLLSAKELPMCIFIDPFLEDMVWEIRDKENTKVIHHSKEQFSAPFFPFFDKVQEIRNDPEWQNQVGWLKDSTQGSMEWYNPMVMSKMFLLHNAKIFNSSRDQKTMIYRWGMGTYHISGWGQKSPDEIQHNTDNLIETIAQQRGTQLESGSIELKPHFKQEYYSQLP